MDHKKQYETPDSELLVLIQDEDFLLDTQVSGTIESTTVVTDEWDAD